MQKYGVNGGHSCPFQWVSLHVLEIKTRLSYYNVKTRLFDLVGLCWLKQNLVEEIC